MLSQVDVFKHLAGEFVSLGYTLGSSGWHRTHDVCQLVSHGSGGPTAVCVSKSSLPGVAIVMSMTLFSVSLMFVACACRQYWRHQRREYGMSSDTDSDSDSGLDFSSDDDGDGDGDGQQ